MVKHAETSAHTLELFSVQNSCPPAGAVSWRAAVRQVQWAVAGGDALCRGCGFRLAVADENVTEKLCALMTSAAAAS